VQEYDAANPATHKGYDLRSMPMAALYKAYGLDPMTVDFIGHALALHRRHLALPRRGPATRPCPHRLGAGRQRRGAAQPPVCSTGPGDALPRQRSAMPCPACDPVWGAAESRGLAAAQG